MMRPMTHTPDDDRVYCFRCDKVVMLVTTDENAFAGHCPICERQPSALERSLHERPGEKMRTKLQRLFGEDDE